MTDAPAALVFPELAHVYALLAPWSEALLRAVVGLALVPHGLRMTFGFFAGTGLKVRNLAMLAKQLDRDGYRPGKVWAPVISVTELLCGPLLATGLFTRPAAIPITLFLLVSIRERWRVGGYFWNTLGFEYTLMWVVAAFYFLVHGGGAYSIDHLVLGREL